MRGKLLALFVLLLGCMSCVQTENSNSADADTYSDVGGHPGFVQVRAIFRQNCTGCHHQFHAQTEEEIIALGDLKLGKAAESSVYYRIRGAKSGPGPQNMPPTGTVSESDLTIIENWINSAN